MSLVRKINPKGVDKVIDKVQVKLYNYLTGLGWSDYESYPRTYKNTRGSNTIPEVYLDSNEYKEVLMDDKFTVTSFFLVDDNRTIDEQLITQGISIIFQANLTELYPSITHRADEEMHMAIYEKLKYFFGANAVVNEIITGVDNVYSDLNISGKLKDKVKLDDISQLHVVKFNLTVGYQSCECC